MGAMQRRKGATGEREAAAFLTSLGFHAKRAVQNGVTDGRDIIVDDMPNVYFEVKRSQSVTLGSEALEDACEQAIKKAKGHPWYVLWRRNGEKWKMTWRLNGIGYATVYEPHDIANVLRKHLPKKGVE